MWQAEKGNAGFHLTASNRPAPQGVGPLCQQKKSFNARFS